MCENATRSEIEIRVSVITPLIEAGLPMIPAAVLATMLRSEAESMHLIMFARLAREYARVAGRAATTPGIIEEWMDAGHIQQHIELARQAAARAETLGGE